MLKLTAVMLMVDRVDTVLAEMDEHNRALGVAVAAAEGERQVCAYKQPP